MSSMLDQAIVDAAALKEAAIKNAETAIIEKYSQEIKNTVDSILSEDVEDDVPYASMSAPPTTPPEENEPENSEDLNSGSAVLELDLSALEKLAMDSISNEVGADAQDMVEHETLADDIEAANNMSNNDQVSGNLDEEIDLGDLFESDNEIEITEKQLKDIVEKLTLDFHPEKTGWLEKPQYETRQAELEALALAVHEEDNDEEMDKLKEALKSSQKQNKILEKKLKETSKGVREMKAFANKVKDTLSEVNLQNARLLYTNKALSSDSLNGRQKDKIVEAISKSKTVEEAKVIYETLQGAVGEQKKTNRAPKSLSEAVTKRSSALLKGSEAKPKSDPNMDRMKRLAGIN